MPLYEIIIKTNGRKRFITEREKESIFFGEFGIAFFDFKCIRQYNYNCRFSGRSDLPYSDM